MEICELTGEIDIYGVLLPELLVYAVVALLAQNLMIRIFGKLGAHRLFWHLPLVEISIFIILLGGIAAVGRRVHP
jgi:protein AaeX